MTGQFILFIVKSVLHKQSLSGDKKAGHKSDFDISYLTLRTSAPRVTVWDIIYLTSNGKAEDPGSLFSVELFIELTVTHIGSSFYSNCLRGSKPVKWTVEM